MLHEGDNIAGAGPEGGAREAHAQRVNLAVLDKTLQCSEEKGVVALGLVQLIDEYGARCERHGDSHSPHVLLARLGEILPAGDVDVVRQKLLVI